MEDRLSARNTWLELGTTFQFSLRFQKHGVGCLNWGLVAGKSQTHFNWSLSVGWRS